MTDVLFIKTSSLGDVIHHMPAVTEARARRPDARFTWVVEEAFAPLVRLHPAVGEAIPVAARNWRRAPWQASTRQELASFLRVLRTRAYDEIIDTQGLFFKSALIARAARGRRHGYDPNSIKEAFACALYDVRHAVEWNQHAIARNRALTGLALGYTPEGPPDFGLDRAALAGPAAAPYGVLLHATARADKEWPEANWRMLAAALGTSVDLVVPFGTEAERERATRIAAATPRARVPDRAPLDADGAAHCRRRVRGRRRHRPSASRRSARRAVGRDLHGERAGPDRTDGRGRDPGAGREGRSAVGRRGGRGGGAAQGRH